MGLKSFFQRKDTAADAAPARTRSRRNAAASDVGEAVQQARTRARQRLIGAVVLLGIGIIGFPLLFETQPRPIPVDLPIDIPRKDAVPPLQLPAPRAAVAPAASRPPEAAPVIVERAEEAGREVPPPAETADRPAAPKPDKPSADKASAEKPPVDKPAAEKPKPADTRAAPKPAPDDAARARALLEGKPAAADASGRFIVQVGAFAEANAARDVRQKVEKLGLKTYTQVIDTDNGKRIRVRVGPFASREEADKAASKIKSAGLASAVLTL